MDIEKAKGWLTARMLSADLIAHYYDLREKGMPGDPGAEAVGGMTAEFMLGRCAFFATAIAKRLGREHMIALYTKDGDLVHAMVACSPQYGPPFPGWCVDVLGRSKLSDAIAQIERAFGPLDVKIGEFVPDEDFAPGEEDLLIDLAGVLPWTRNFVGQPAARERDPQAFILCVSAACQTGRGASFSP